MNSNSKRFQEPEYFDIDQSKSKLPVEGKRNVLITSALPYVNNVPHLGTIIGAVLSADVFSRFCHMRGYQSLYICGTDEYGTATEMKALAEGVTPKEICDKFYKLHKQVYDWFGIDFDYFGRTTTKHQTDIAQEIFLKMYNNGYTSVDKQMQLHCGTCKKFLADRYVNGICPHCKYSDARGDQCDGCGRLLDGIELIEPKCFVCCNKPTIEESKHIFLNLDQLTPKIQSYLDDVLNAKGCHWSSSAIAITKSWLKMGLEKRCITRDLKWGTPVPLEEFASKVFYVWFDAPIGYLSITKSLLGDDWIRWWKNPKQVELFNFLGKDNVVFHSIIFPATLLATNEVYTTAKNICATEYLNYEDQKFSKSRGIGVFGDAVANIGIPADVFRFYLLYMRPEGQDTSFCWDDFMLKVNSELLANLGNFILRALTFLANNLGGIQPEMQFGTTENELFTAIDADLKEYTTAMEEVRMRDALQRILAISRRGNQYMQAGQPWVLVKGNADEKKQADTIIGVASNLAAFISLLLYPFMPTVSAQIREQCNLPKPIALPTQFTMFLKPGHKLNKPFPLFTKLEQAKVEQWKKLFAVKTPMAANIKTETLTYDINGALNTKVVTKNVSNKKQQKKGKTIASVATPKIVENNVFNANDKVDVDKLYAEILDKFQQAKKHFFAKQIERVDAENNQLRAQIDAYKSMCGYTGPLFNIPSDATKKTGSEKQQPKEQQKTPSGTTASVPVNNAKAETPQVKEVNGANVKKTKGGQKEENASASSTKQKENPKTEGIEALDVGRLDLRVGRIINAKKHPDADALYVEEIDLGEDKPRTVVSGLVRFVPIEQMQNRLVVCLCNLKPAKMRGIESQAMVMCASTLEKVEILEVDPACKPGDFVYSSQFPRRPDLPFMNPKKKIWESIAPDLAVTNEGECAYKGHVLNVVSGNNNFTLKAPTLRGVPVK